ncbi:DUF397 domain-containing protein [Streptomyces sp. CAI-85]|uniref:DUF397 domain-containing protein n=1 Tax=Streptomyces sp. CAI-85 TaxID=1472662 RepID=UPI0015879EFA|nr:DUF397 domain-containing protein [Streptomyces sp. CAI-85]NUV64303.1 DUF397 domain-containing protein [Streptomyces sp. CAI-85]
MAHAMHAQHWNGAPYVKSSHSDPDNCVYAARPACGPVAVMDGKRPDGPRLVVDRAPWTAFVEWTGQAGQ